MENALLRLRTLRVSDVMSKEVVMVLTGDTLKLIADRFAHHQISSAPVVDADGRCVGMLSAADFLKRERRPKPSRSTEPTASELMSHGVQTIQSHAPLLWAAHIMCVEHVHRLPVIDQEKLVGMISTMDVVAALITALDEMNVKCQPLDS